MNKSQTPLYRVNDSLISKKNGGKMEKTSPKKTTPKEILYFPHV